MDKRWITQYNSLFCVLNHIGQVVTWRLTPSVSFDTIKDTLTALKDRFAVQGKPVKEFYIDNCCSWRNSLQAVFRPHLKVYLDLFHAIKRVGDKIPKRHPFRSECMADLRMVFRDPSDRGPQRQKPTPSSTTLLANMETFVWKWRSVQSNDKLVLNQAAIRETENLKKHTEKGCLSGIGPGRGTNRNERLHRQLNTIMSSSRYGVELGYALLSTCMFQHNEKQVAKAEKRMERTIDEYIEKYFHQPDPSERFGLCFSRFDCSDPGEHETDMEASDLSPLAMETSTYDHFQKRVHDTCRQPTVIGSPCVITGDSADMVRQPVGHILELLPL